MQFLIRNQAEIPNKYIRFAKWKLLQAKRKFDQMIYAEVYISKEGQSPEIYTVNLKLGVSGKDIVVSSESDDLNVLWSDISDKVHRHLRKHKELMIERRRTA